VIVKMFKTGTSSTKINFGIHGLVFLVGQFKAFGRTIWKLLTLLLLTDLIIQFLKAMNHLTTFSYFLLQI